jgi:thiamine-phosphate pyrophosphorylase
LVAITDLTLAPAASWLERLSELARASRPGALAVLLRDHQLPAAARLDFGRALRERTRAEGQELWVADRLDLATLLDADGLHLGEASVPASLARTLWARPISRAWHATELSAELEPELTGVSALLVSPVAAPRKGRQALGLEGLSQVARALPDSLRLYALGGMTARNAAASLPAGAWGIAAIGAALTEDPRALTDALDITR